MKHFPLKIRECFLPLIRDGRKKHEYRLATRKVRVGDVLVLISNQNSQDYLKVLVSKVSHYSNWKDALIETWESDFKGLFNSLDELLNECKRFYKEEDIVQYGIDVYEIIPYKKRFENSKFLLDTNVIIEREGFNNVLPEVAHTYNWIDKMHGLKIVHPLTFDEIDKYGNKPIRDGILIKLKSYETLTPSKEENESFRKLCAESSQDENTQNDLELLLQVYNGAADYLITSDRGILNKADKLYIRDSVLSPNEFLIAIENENPKLVDYDVLSVELVKIGSLDVNDAFFDTLREDYGGIEFNNWLNKKSCEDAYVFIKHNELKGFLYLKTENEDESYDDIEPVFSPAKRLKVGTFKISHRGLKVGERFLKIIFDNALLRNVDEIYVTMFEDRREGVVALKNLMEKWGFVQKGVKKSSGEIVLVKDMRKYDYSKDSKFNYPLQKANKNIYFLPIYPEFHTKLFPDLHLKNESMHLYNEEACEYALEKIYVTGWSNLKCTPGDLVCVYRIGHSYKTFTSVVTGIGVIQEVLYPSTLPSFIDACQKKSVFTETELAQFFNTYKYRTIVKVLFLEALRKKVILDSLHKNGILPINEGPRLTTTLSSEKYLKLRQLGGLNE